MKLALLLCFAIFSSYSGTVIGKECTNIPTQLSSHTLRYDFFTSKNTTWKEEVIQLYHLNHEEESTWMGLLPRKILRSESSDGKFDWTMLYRTIKWGSRNDQSFLKEISLHDVRLDPDSKHGQAQQTNLEYLLMLDVDNLVWSFRKQVGFATPGQPYGGWEGPDVELRGHFVGHYMSATARMWASTHNASLQQKMTAVVDALYECQRKDGTGYLSAFPSEFFDRFEAIRSVWAPYYTIHKIMAGLLDQYLFAGNSRALDMVVWMAEYFANRVQNVIIKYSIERHWLSLNEETGGMNDVLYNLYAVTGDQKHLILAHLFDKPCFLGLLAVQADSISGFHANTHIPVVIGAQRRYEVTGDSLYKDIGTFFMDIVNSSHSYATGGTSVREFWSNPKRLADTLQTENEESCTTYNMLKIARNLFRWTKEISYADYYERALTNGVLSIQRGTQPGIMIYMLPQGHGVSKARSYHRWGTPFNSFWCCYGTGIESFSKLGDSIYFEESGSTPTLYVIQFISSSLNWKSGGVVLQQKIDLITSSVPSIKMSYSFSSNESIAPSSTLKLRIPSWTSVNGAAAEINGQKLDMTSPGSFLSITKKWGKDDVLTLILPVGLRTEAIRDDRPEYSCIQSIIYGPYVLAGLSTGDWNIKASGAKSMTDWIKAISSDYNSQLISLTQESSNGTLVLMNSGNSLVMEQVPEEGTDAAVRSTFRVAHTNSRHSRLSSRKIVGGETIMLEPFDIPGAAVLYLKPNSGLIISAAADSGNSLFNLIAGLDGKPNSVSLESVSYPGCYITHTTGNSVQLMCEGGSSWTSKQVVQDACFMIHTPMREYNPISFVARGTERNFILEPLLSLKDESYTVYFNMTA